MLAGARYLDAVASKKLQHTQRICTSVTFPDGNTDACYGRCIKVYHFLAKSFFFWMTVLFNPKSSELPFFRNCFLFKYLDHGIIHWVTLGNFLLNQF